LLGPGVDVADEFTGEPPLVVVPQQQKKDDEHEAPTKLSFSGSFMLNDAAFDLCRAMRDQAFADLCRRSANAWRDGPAVAPPLNAMPPTPYEQQKPGEPDNGQRNGDDENGDDGRINLAEAQPKRDSAYAAQYDRQRWRELGNPTGVLDPTTASAIQAQGIRWRGGA
jgi:hypothetical protein